MANISKQYDLDEWVKRYLIKATNQGIKIQGKLIDYPIIIRSLDEGKLDDRLLDGLDVVSELSIAETAGYFSLEHDQRISVLRWLVATIFVREQIELNGFVNVTHGNEKTEKTVVYQGKYGGIAIYPASERLALANNIEEFAYKRYSLEEAQIMAQLLYLSMLETSPNGRDLRLSDWGRKQMIILHDEAIERIYKNGLPPEPTEH